MNTSLAIRVIRIACAVIFVLCIAGLIISSIAGNNEGWVLSLSLIHISEPTRPY